MHPEAAFLAGYALSLAFVAVGLEWLGRRSTDPWASRSLAACRAPTEQPAHEGPDWPHSEVPAFHLVLAAVALAAAFVITALSGFRHHETTELVIHSALLVIIAVRIRHLVIEHRTLTRRVRRQPAVTAIGHPAPEGIGSKRLHEAKPERQV